MDRNSPLDSVRQVSIPVAASILELSERKIWKLIAAGDLKAHRFGRATRVAMSDLESLVARAAEVPPSRLPARQTAPSSAVREASNPLEAGR